MGMDYYLFLIAGVDASSYISPLVYEEKIPSYVEINEKKKKTLYIVKMVNQFLGFTTKQDGYSIARYIKVGSLQGSALNFKLFYRRYIDCCEKKSEFVEDIGEHLKND